MIGVDGANEGRRVGTTRPTQDGPALAGAATGNGGALREAWRKGKRWLPGHDRRKLGVWLSRPLPYQRLTWDTCPETGRILLTYRVGTVMAQTPLAPCGLAGKGNRYQWRAYVVRNIRYLRGHCNHQMKGPKA